jgi:cytochrome b subunit of formate dehydrogenase
MRLLRFAPFLILALVPASPGPALAAGGSDDCLACHGDPSLSKERGGKAVSLHVDAALLKRSTHRDLGCTDCHEGFDAASLPHKAKIEPVNCLSCHGDAAEKHPFHARMSETDGKDGGKGLACKECHGTHDVTPPRGEGGKFQGARLVESCGSCHSAEAKSFADSSHGKALAGGAAWAPDCISCHMQPLTAERWKGDEASLKVAQEKVCLSCHLDNPEVRARMGPTGGFIAAYEKSVHGAELLAGNGKAANCVDCHGSHEMRQGLDPRARVNKERIPQTCARCHPVQAEKYGESVHAAALKRGNLSSPVCTDCHGEHNILLTTDPRSPVAAKNVSAQVCTPCHSSIKLSEKYGIPADRPRTFADSYHGLAIRGGGMVEVANCASCHGAHDIKPGSDPTSSVNKANLAGTCGKCHPGANWRFAVGSVHVVTRKAQSPILYWVASLYIGLIVVTVGGMAIHNTMDFFKKSRRKLRIRSGELAEEEHGHALYLRMTRGERIQHACLMASFVLLVVTGFMLHYPDAWWVRGIRRLSRHAFEARSLAHRIAGVVMVAASIAHIGYLFTARGKQFLRDIFPNRRDLFDAAGYLLYISGISSRKPSFGRFGYIEKAEYWALVWGTIVMAATGAILWFENTFIGLLTKLGWDVARTVHFYEAWLATLAILVWHIYYVVFNPEVYPMNTAWISGSLPESVMAEEHPLELEAIRRAEAAEEMKEAEGDAAGDGKDVEARGESA